MGQHLAYSDSLCQVSLGSWACMYIPTLAGVVLLKSPSAEEKMLPLCFGWRCSYCSWHLTLILPWKVYIKFSTQSLVLCPWLVVFCMHFTEQADWETLALWGQPINTGIEVQPTVTRHVWKVTDILHKPTKWALKAFSYSYRGVFWPLGIFNNIYLFICFEKDING